MHSHYPIPSPKPEKALSDILKSAESRLRGKLLPIPVNGQTSISSLFSTCLYKKDFPKDLSALISSDGRMGLTFRQLDDMSRRVGKILELKFAQVSRSINPLSPSPEAPNNNDGDPVVGILTNNGNEIDERVVVFLLAILKLGAAYVHIQKEQFKSKESWKIFVRRVQPLIVIYFDDINENQEEDIFVGLLSSKVICSINTESGKKKLPLPYFFESSSQLWGEALACTDKGSVTPLKLSTEEGERAAIISPNFVPGNGIKWIRIGHKLIHIRNYWEKTEFPIQEQERFHLTYPITDPRGLAQLFFPLCLGKAIQLLNPDVFTGKIIDDENNFPVEQLLDQIFLLQLHRINLSPGRLEELIDFAEKTKRGVELSSVRFWMISGGYFTLELGQKFFSVYPSDRKCILTLFYGCPEVLWAATAVSYPSFKEMLKRSVQGKVCFGTPLHNLSITVLDDKNWAESSFLAKGEICINVKDFETGARDFLQTGDLGRIVKEKGTLKVLIVEGRTNTRVKVKGKTIDLVELAENVEKEKIARHCVAFVSPRTKDLQTVVVAYVSKAVLTPIKQKQVEKAIKKVEPLVNTSIPVNSIPLLSNGQVDFRLLRKEYQNYLTNCENILWDDVLKIKEDKVSPSQYEIDCAKVLFKSIATSVGKRITWVTGRSEKTFWALATASDSDKKWSGISQATKAARVIASVKSQGFLLTPEDLVSAESLKMLVKRMAFAGKQEKLWRNEILAVKNLILYEKFKIDHWNSIINLLKTDFDSKATMFSAASLQRFWKRALDDIMKENLSVVALVDKQVVGCALNCTVFPKSEYVPTGMNRIFGLIQTAEDASKGEMLTPTDKKLMKTFYIAVNDAALESEGFKLMMVRDLLQKSWNLSQKSGDFGAYMVCTANPLIQETATCLLNYKALLELPCNRYKTQKLEKPFWDRDDHEKIGVYFKTTKSVSSTDVSLCSFRSNGKYK